MKKISVLILVLFIFYACGSHHKKHNSTNTSNSTTNTTTANTNNPAEEYAKTITQADLKEHLYTYASDAYQGREAGEEGEEKAVNYLKNYYVTQGISSALPNNNYFQEVPLQVIQYPEIVMTFNGIEYKSENNFVSAISSPDTEFTVQEIVYVGFGIEDPKYSSYKDVDVTDKVILIKAGEPTKKGNISLITGTTEASKWANFRQEIKEKYEVAKQKGARAVLFYNPDSYNYIVNRYKKHATRMSLEGNLNDMHAFLLNTNFAKTLHADIETTELPRRLPIPFSLSYTNNINHITGNNVAAFIKGSEKPEEVLVISAHLDHVGVTDAKVYNGADDDGSGTVAILEIAQAFKQAVNDGKRPKRSILFLHVTAEEKGLLGSEFYTDRAPIFPLENTIADLNIDMIGRTDPKRTSKTRNYVYLIGSDRLSTQLHEVSEQVNNQCCKIDLDYTFNAENDPNRFYYRSDHYNFAKHNVPVIFYFNGTHEDYHQPGDTPDKIQYDLLENRTRLIFYTAWELANRNQRIVVDKATN